MKRQFKSQWSRDDFGQKNITSILELSLEKDDQISEIAEEPIVVSKPALQVSKKKRPKTGVKY